MTTLAHTRAGPPIGAPVTVAFGSRDHLLVRRSRQLGELPPSTRRAALPGHEPRESAHPDQADDAARRHELPHRHHPAQHGDEPVGVRLAV